MGAVWEVAAAGGWVTPEQPGAWIPVARSFRDDHTTTWWGGEGRAGRYGPERSLRLVIATPDPATLPETATWYLATTLPLAAADVAEVVRLYGLRNGVEQQDKQIKGSLGWSQYPVRSDVAMRRHWALVQCAFAFCWWAEGWPSAMPPPDDPVPAARDPAPPATEPALDQVPPAKRGGKGVASRPGVAAAVALLARGAAAGARLAGTGSGPLALLDWLGQGNPLPLYDSS